MKGLDERGTWRNMTDQRKRNIPMVDLNEELKWMRTPILDTMTDVLDSGNYILGKKGEKLEKSIANFIETPFSLGVGNGTDALILSLLALDIGPGDEVITTPFTFFATAEAIARVGAKPVFVDIERDTYNIDPHKIESAITDKTKAIIVVHLFGKAADMKAITKIANYHQLKVIEDACQSIGTEYQNQKTGALGDIGCFSFFPSKSLGAFGDAGMITTNHLELYNKIKQLRNHGSEKKYVHTMIGMNSRLDEFQAAILLVKLHYLNTFLQYRKQAAKRYTENLKFLVKTPSIPDSKEHTFHQYCIELTQRNELAHHLNKHGIASAIYYPTPLHLQTAFHDLSYKKGDFPIAEQAADRILALPMSPMLTMQQQEHIISTIERFMKHNG